MVEAFRAHDSCTDRPAVLHQSNWDRHKAKRIELEGHLHHVRMTVEDPDFAVRRPDGAIDKYRKGFGEGKLRNTFLLVIEKPHDGGADPVVSMWFTPEVRDGDLICLQRLAMG